jgi:hypothetical protein
MQFSVHLHNAQILCKLNQFLGVALLLMIPVIWLDFLPAHIDTVFSTYLFPIVLIAFLLLFILAYHAYAALPRDWAQLHLALRPCRWV